MASPIQYNIDLANRQIQVNEWAYNNKNDTLFFFQLMFISLMFITIILCLKSMGFVGGEFVWYSIGVLALINVVIIINRSVYTNMKRDSRTWNKKHFSGDNNTPSPIQMGDKNYQSYIDSVRSNYGTPKTQCTCPTSMRCC